MRLAGATSKPAPFQIDDAHDHGAVRIARRVHEPEAPIERTLPIIERMRQNAEAADIPRKSHRNRQREPQQRPRNAAPLIAPINGELAAPHRRQLIGLAALRGPGKPGALNLRGAERPRMTAAAAWPRPLRLYPIPHDIDGRDRRITQAYHRNVRGHVIHNG